MTVWLLSKADRMVAWPRAQARSAPATVIKAITPIIAVFALLLPAAAATPASAATECKTVIRKVHTQPHWVRVAKTRKIHGRKVVVRRHGKIVYVFVRRSYVIKHETVCPTGPVSLHSHIDPSFTQDPTNPLAVTYAYSASATETINGVSRVAASLPNGVLDFYSDGLLACSINVGGSVSGGLCPVTYKALGAHTVITTYISGTISATETATEQIKPFTTTTGLVVDTPPECGAGAEDETHCTYTAEVSSVDQNGNPPKGGGLSIVFKFQPEISGEVAFPTLGEQPALPVNTPFQFSLRDFHKSGEYICYVAYENGNTQVGNPSSLPCGTSVSAEAVFRGSADWAESHSGAVQLEAF